MGGDGRDMIDSDGGASPIWWGGPVAGSHICLCIAQLWYLEPQILAISNSLSGVAWDMLLVEQNNQNGVHMWLVYLDTDWNEKSVEESPHSLYYLVIATIVLCSFLSPFPCLSFASVFRGSSHSLLLTFKDYLLIPIMALVVETTTIGPNDASKDSLNDWIWVFRPTQKPHKRRKSNQTYRHIKRNLIELVDTRLSRPTPRYVTGQ